MEFWLQQTAWTMDKPKPYGIMHLSFFLGGMILAFSTAYLLRKLSVRKRNYLIFGIGVVLILSEIFKQLFLYVIVNDYNYNWWYFPFQLCSVPMYLCLIIPWIKQKTIRTSIFTFLMDIFPIRRYNGFFRAFRTIIYICSSNPAFLYLAYYSNVIKLYHWFFRRRRAFLNRISKGIAGLGYYCFFCYAF